eukprot:1608846-Amphidinium_carterae.1
MSASTLESFQKKGMQEIHCMPTARRHTMSGGNRLTHSALQKHSSAPCIHIQCSIKRIQRVAAFQSKSCKSLQRYPLTQANETRTVKLHEHVSMTARHYMATWLKAQDWKKRCA